MIDRGPSYLRARLGRDPTGRGRRAQRAGRAGQPRLRRSTCSRCCNKPDPGYANKLLETKAELPRYGKAFLARALALNLGAQDPAVTELLDDLARAP